MERTLINRWLVDPAQAEQFEQAYETACEDVSFLPAVNVSKADRIEYLAWLLAARSPSSNVFCINPQWGATEQAAADDVVLTNQIDFGLGKILIPTGGTGGKIKFAIHTWETLSASVEGYARFWNRAQLNAICPLPVCHIGGLMLALRTFITGGQLWLADPKLEQAPPPGFDLSTAHVSLVGAQLRRALDNDIAWLRECEAVLVGGGPTDRDLAREAVAAGIPLYAAYGLTEAAATVALAKVTGEEDTLRGKVLPHWRVEIREGEICLAGPALFKGYMGEAPRTGEFWPTGDRGQMVDGALEVLGRSGRMIITGGKKVDADFLESRLREWPEVRDVVVVGREDPKWGMAVTALAATDYTPEQLTALAQQRLMPEMRPKQWFATAIIPRGENGKLAWDCILSLMNSK